MKFHILDADHNVVEASFREKFAFDLKTGGVGIRVAEDYVGQVQVSTVFAGGVGPDGCFETMVDDGRRWKWDTWQEAEIGHQFVLNQVRAEAEALAGQN